MKFQIYAKHQSIVDETWYAKKIIILKILGENDKNMKLRKKYGG